MTLSYFVTGATGFVGGHVAEACAARGLPVRTIARSGSDLSLLKKLGVAIHTGDLSDAELVRRSVEGADVIVHCAAKVGDWGPVEDYRTVNVEALRSLLEACKGRPIRRFVHLSTLGVYAARHHHGTDESEPLPARHMDGYTQTKVEAERLALQYYRDQQVPVVVLRPGFVYGPRDRTLMPKLIENLRQRTLRYVGRGKTALNCIFVGNLVDAIFLAIERPEAVGQIYNLTDGEPVTKRQFIEAIIQAMGFRNPRPFSPPLWLAQIVAAGSEGLARLRGATEAPTVTRARIKFLGMNLDFSIAKARRELGYQPRVPFREAMRQTMAWYQQKA